jgi:hypothetical protein
MQSSFAIFAVVIAAKYSIFLEFPPKITTIHITVHTKKISFMIVYVVFINPVFLIFNFEEG